MNRRQVPGPGGAGFTLVELLVAISILGLVAVLGWRGLDGIVRSRVALTQQLEQTRGMQLAFAQMQSDCEHLAGAALLHQRQNLAAENGRLTLVRTVLQENQAARLQVVAYRVRDGVLTRRESDGTRDLLELDTMWQAALSADDAGAAGVALQGGITGMALRLWDGAWRLPAAGGARSATGLEVRLLGQGGGLVKLFLLGAL